MKVEEIILEFLAYSPEKKITLLGMSLLVDELEIDPKKTARIIFDMYVSGKIDLIGIDQEDIEPENYVIRLIPKFEIVK